MSESASKAALRAFYETADLCKQKLDARNEKTKHAYIHDDDEEAHKRLAWLCRMLLATADEAVRANYALGKANDEQYKEQLRDANAASAALDSAAATARQERDALREQFRDEVERNRQLTVELYQQRHRDAQVVKELKLKNERNRIMRLDILLSMGSVSLGRAAVVAGIFGMNLDFALLGTKLDTFPGGLWLVAFAATLALARAITKNSEISQ